MSDAWHGVEHAFKKAASVVTFGLVDDPDDPEGGFYGGGGSGRVQLESVAGLNYDNKLLDKPDVTPDDSTMFLAQNYQEESDHLRRSTPVVKPKPAVDKEITPETLMLAGGLLAAAVLLSE